MSSPSKQRGNFVVKLDSLYFRRAFRVNRTLKVGNQHINASKSTVLCFYRKYPSFSLAEEGGNQVYYGKYEISQINEVLLS